MRLVKLNIALVVFYVATSLVGISQYDGLKGYGIYHKYDKSYINPDTRGKHSVSLGAMATVTSPINIEEFAPGWGAHLGYNYLIIKRRKRFFGIKESFRLEPQAAFGLHFSYAKGSQVSLGVNNSSTSFERNHFYVMLNYFNPLISLKGKIFSLYFINEYGLGVHRFSDVESGNKKSTFNISLEPLRVRLGKGPLFIHLTVNSAVGNNFLGKDRLDVGFFGGLRYYIYKKK